MSNVVHLERPAGRANITLAWMLGRVVLVLALLYLLRKPLLDTIEATVDIIGITLFTIDRASTPLTRALLAIGAALGFFAIAKTAARFVPKHAYLAALGAAALLTLLAAFKIGGGIIVAALVIALLAANWAPLSALARIGLTAPHLDALIRFIPGVSEALLTSRFVGTVRNLIRNTPFVLAEIPAATPGAIIAAFALAILVPGDKLVKYEQKLRSGHDVHAFAWGDFNGLAYDALSNRLFATGHGAQFALAYDGAKIDAPPAEVSEETGYAQGFALDPAHGELHVYNSATHKILSFDSQTLLLKRSFAAPDISPGDSWIEADPHSDLLIVASEADQQVGQPLVIFDRATGAVREKRNDEAGNLLINPDAPILYMSFFRRVGGVIAYDLKAQKVLANAPTDARMDRMAYDPAHKSLLIASPAEGRIQEFDALTLAPKGAFPGIFGVRVIAIDQASDAMLVGSLATGKVALLGLTDRKIKRSWYLGPWLRSIVIAPGKGLAYVSSEKGLYELRYAGSAK